MSRTAHVVVFGPIGSTSANARLARQGALACITTHKRRPGCARDPSGFAEGQGAALDVAQEDDGYIVKASARGVKPWDREITLIDNVLTIDGELKDDQKDGLEIKDGHYHLRERRLPRTAGRREAIHFQNAIRLCYASSICKEWGKRPHADRREARSHLCAAGAPRRK